MQGRLCTWDGGIIQPIGGDLPDLLVRISRRRSTGTLRINCADGERNLFVSKGEIIFAESSCADDRLGEYLLRMGRLRLPDHVALSSQMGKGKRLGALLVENGFLKVDELVPAVMGQVRRIVVRLFRQSDFSYEFIEQPLRKEAITLKMRLAELIIEGAQQVDSWRRLVRGIGALDERVAVRSQAVADFTGLKLSSEVLQILALLEHPTVVAEVGSKSKISDFRCAQVLWAFRALGWIEAIEPEPASSEAVVVPLEAAVIDASIPSVQGSAEPAKASKPSNTLSRLGDYDFDTTGMDGQDG